MASLAEMCDICESRQNQTDAANWCSECDEFLCKECYEHHNNSKSTKKHFSQTIENYRKIPGFVLDVPNRCSIHNGKLDFLCPSHNELCCVQCLHEEHKSCEQLTPLQSAISGIRESTLLSDLEITLKEMGINFTLLTNECEDMIESLKTSMDSCKKEINELRMTLEAHLRKIEKQIIDDLTVKYKKCLQMKENLKTIFENTTKRIEKTAKDVTNMKEFASDFQIFQGIRELDKMVKDDKHSIETLVHDEAFKLSTCKFEVSPAIFYIKSDFTILGQTSLIDNPVTFTPQTLRGKEAQMICSPGYSIHNYALRRFLQLTIPESKMPMRMTGCTASTNGEFIFADKSNDRILVFETNGMLRKEFSTKGSPVDVAYLELNHVATTMSDVNKIKFINIETGSTSHKITIPGTGYGISRVGSRGMGNSECNLLTRIKNFGFLLTDATGKESQLIKYPGECILYAVGNGELLFFTKWDDNLVYCCDTSGKVFWKFENAVLQRPCGLALTKEGNVIVAGFDSNNIVIISHDGKHFKELYKNYEQMQNPTAIHLHYKTDLVLLVVTNLNDGLCNVFEVTLDK